jgi:diguanylate cyclase (GGDEF)-like protein
MRRRERAATIERAGELASLVAVVGTIVAIVCLSGFAWSTIAAAGRSEQRTQVANAQAARFDHASTALEDVQAAAATYVLRPRAGTALKLEHARALLTAAIASLRAPAGDVSARSTAAQLALGAASVGNGIARLQKAVEGATAGNVVGLEQYAVSQPIDGMRTLIQGEVSAYNGRAATSMAASRAASARLSVVAFITAALGAAVALAVLRMMRLRTRLADAHGREVERLRTAALRDSLTGLRNHRSFHEDLRSAVTEGRARYLLLADLDDLKETNDECGHKAGDELLVKLAGTLDAVAGSHGGAAYRVGGDEFAVLITQAADVDQVAAEIHAACGRTSAPAPAATIGTSTWEHRVGADELLRRADLALITAKPEGIATQRYTIRLETARSRADIERAELRAVLDTPGAIMPVFQPMLDLRTREIVGYEALTRFPLDSGRTTQEWFDLARRHGLAVELEAAAVRAAMHVPGRPEGVALFLNLSPEVLLAGRHPLELPHDLSAITVEITENALVTEGPELELALQSMRARGARIAVDDAGAGYAGFAQLIRVRPDMVKLDRSLVHGVHTDPTKAAVIKAFVGFANDTGALICAEGIETVGELKVVTDLGAAMGQGYLLGCPQPQWMPDRIALLPHRPVHDPGRVIALRPAASA